MPAKTKNMHVCCFAEGEKYCDCLDVPDFVLDIARKELPMDLGSLAPEQIRDRLINTGKASLNCRECQHTGMLTMPIVGPPPGDKGGGWCNAEEDFAICPNCGHWAVLHIRHEVRFGDSV